MPRSSCVHKDVCAGSQGRNIQSCTVGAALFAHYPMPKDIIYFYEPHIVTFIAFNMQHFSHRIWPNFEIRQFVFLHTHTLLIDEVAVAAPSGGGLVCGGFVAGHADIDGVLFAECRGIVPSINGRWYFAIAVDNSQIIIESPSANSG